MTRETGSRPTVSVPPFGEHGYGTEEQSHLQGHLAKKLGPSLISQRPSTTEGQRIAFVETWKLIALANELFGFNGWSNSITSQSIDFVDESDGQYSAGVNACVRVTLRDGTHHEELGYGTADGLPSKGVCLEKARKEAVTDGLKRCLRNFGNALGNCLGDEHYLQWVVNQSDTHPTLPANSSTDSLVSELITAAQMAPSTNESTTASGPATTLDVQQQQFIQLQLQHQIPLSCLPPAARLGQPTFSSQHQQQVPLLAPFALAAATGGATAGLATSSAQQLFLVRPVAAQTSGLATPAGLLPGNSFTTQLQQRPHTHQLQRLHGIFNNVNKMSSAGGSVAPTAQGSLPITIQSGSSSTSGVHTVMTNNFIQPVMANHVQGGMLNLQTALSNSQTNFLGNLQNGLSCNVQNLQNSGQSSATNLVVQNCISNCSPKSVPSSVSVSTVSNSPNSVCKNTFTKTCSQSKSMKSAVKCATQNATRDIAPRNSVNSHTSGKKCSSVDAADIACTTESYVSRLRVVMPPLEKPVQAVTAQSGKSTRGDSNKSKKRSRTNSNSRETIPSDLGPKEPRRKKVSIPLVTIHRSLDPKDDLIDIKQEAMDLDDSSFALDIEPLKNCEVMMDSFSPSSREESPNEKQDDAYFQSHTAQEAMNEDCCGGVTARDELVRGVVADALSKLYKEGANEEEMDFDRHSDILRKEVEGKTLSKTKAKAAVTIPVLGENSAVEKELENKRTCKTQSKPLVTSPRHVDSGRSPKKVSVHIPVLGAHQKDFASATNVNLDDQLNDLLENNPFPTELMKSSSSIETANTDVSVRSPKSVQNLTTPDKDCLDTVNLNISRKDRLRSVRLLQNSEKECSTKSTMKSGKRADERSDKEYTNRPTVSPEKEKSTRNCSKSLESETEGTRRTPTNVALACKKSAVTDGESNVGKSSTKNDLTTRTGRTSRSSMTKENSVVEGSNTGQSNGQNVELPSESKSKASSILKRVNYEKTKQTYSCVTDAHDDKNIRVSKLENSCNDQAPLENCQKDQTVQLEESKVKSHCNSKHVRDEGDSTKINGEESDVGNDMIDEDKSILCDNSHSKLAEKSDKPSRGNPGERTATSPNKNEEVKSLDSVSDVKTGSPSLEDEFKPITASTSAKDEDPSPPSAEYKDLFNQSNSPLSEDENTFTGFTADMFMKKSPQTLIDLEMHIIKRPKLPVRESASEKVRTALKLDRQRHFRHNLRIKFKGSGESRGSSKKATTASTKRTAGVTGLQIANGYQSGEPTPSSPSGGEVMGSDVVEGLDNFASSLGLTPRRLLSDSPVTPPSAFLPEKQSSTSSLPQQEKSTSHPLLPSTHMFMKALQQSGASSAGASVTSDSTPVTAVSDGSHSKPSKSLNNNCDNDEDAMSPDGTKTAATKTTLVDRRACASPFSEASSLSPLQRDGVVISKPNSLPIVTSIPSYDNRNERSSKSDTGHSSSEQRNSIFPEPGTAVPRSVEGANSVSLELKVDLAGDPVTTTNGVSKDNDDNPSRGSSPDPNSSDCMSSYSTAGGKTLVGCSGNTKLPSTSDKGVIDDRAVKETKDCR